MGLSQVLNPDQKDTLLDSLENIYNHPVHGRQIKRVLKDALPGFSDPTLEIQEAEEQRASKTSEEIEGIKSTLTKKEIQDKLKEERRAFIDDGIVTKAEMKEVEKLMLEKGIGSYDTAIEFYKAQKQLAIPTTAPVEKTRISVPSEIEWFKDPKGYARKKAYEEVARIERERA